jgi:hypothetical protein
MIKVLAVLIIFLFDLWVGDELPIVHQYEKIPQESSSDRYHNQYKWYQHKNRR